MKHFLAFSTSLALLAAVTAQTSTLCNHDNCLRGLLAQSKTATAFCSSYTTATNTATTSLPTYATACSDSPSRISSACGCLMTPLPCTPSPVINEATRNGGFDHPPIASGATVASEPPWYYHNLQEAIGDFVGIGAGTLASGGVAAFHMTPGAPSEFPEGFLSSDLTVCAGTTYSISFAARQTNASQNPCMIALFSSRDGQINFPNTITGFAANFAEYGPFVYTAKVYPQYVNVPPAPQNADGTYSDTFTFGVYCGENTYPPVTADVLFEIDNVQFVVK